MVRALTVVRGRRGFSLLEVIFAFLLVTLVVLCLATVLIGGLRLLSLAQDTAQAGALARQEVEKIQEGDFAFAPVNCTFDGRRPDPAVGGFPPGPYPTQDLGKPYTLVVRVQTLDEKLNCVIVEVHWDVDKVQTLETLVRR